MLKNKCLLLFNLTVVALVLGLASSALAIQTKSRMSQGNNLGFEMNLGSSVFTGTSEYPRGSGNRIPTYEGCWGHFLSVARDIDGDGVMEDTSYGRSRGRTIPGQRGTLEAMDIVLEGFAAGHRMDQWMGRVENNEVWSSLDPDCLARWPAEFRTGRTMTGEPILHGAETAGVMHSDVWQKSYHRNVPPPGSSMEYQLYFLNYAESNDIAYGHLFLRNMSEYLKYNDNTGFREDVASTQDGQVWGGFALIYVENYIGIGYDAVRMDEGWAFHPEKEIKCQVDYDGLESGFTQGGFAFMLGYKSLRACSFGGETMQLTNCNNMRWGSDFGFSISVDIGTTSESGWVHEWACAVHDGIEEDLSHTWFKGELSPWTGRPAVGHPGMLLPTDERFSQWLWGRAGRINYTAWSELHDFGPRDTTSTEFAIMCCYPADPPMILKPSALEYIDDPELQEQMAPMEHMGDVVKLVYEGGYILPETPKPPPLTIIPGDRQVTITWSNVNVNTPDAYYYFIQEHPDVDPEGKYREYDFEGYKLYRNYVGPSDAHSEMIFQCSLSDNNIQFYWIDTRDKDLAYRRLRNGMKVWYALVPYDRNWDAKQEEWFSLPAEDQSKVWNRTAPAGYYTVRSRSEASNFVPAALESISYVGTAPVEAAYAELAGVDEVLTEAPKWLQPQLDFAFEVVNNERIAQDLTLYVAGTRRLLEVNSMCRMLDPVTEIKLLDGNRNEMGPASTVRLNGAMDAELAIMNPADEDGVNYAITLIYESTGTDAKRDFHNYFDPGTYTGATITPVTTKCDFGPRPTIGGMIRAGRYEVTWKAAGADVSVDVENKTRGITIPFGPYADEMVWGFMPGGTYMDFYNDLDDDVPQADRTALLLETVPADNTDEFALYVNGIVWGFEDITEMPAAGTKFTIDNCYGSWNGDGTVFTQNADPPDVGDEWKVSIKAMSLNPEDADLTKVKVVPNPYIASSTLDQSSSNRRIEFINLPDKCTIRVYSLGGNLVNVLNHIGASRTGWGNYVNVDYILPDNTPFEFTGYENHSGTEAWNLRNRFGQTVASGLYFFHVTDSRGETYTGKFYIVN